ncbi:hypothetical protein D3C80_1688180 [compost metagenome]
MTGTGLKKCNPTTRSGRVVAAASRVIEIDDVLDARIASGRTMASNWAIRFNFNSRFSVAASITTSQSARSERLTLVRILDKASDFC